MHIAISVGIKKDGIDILDPCKQRVDMIYQHAANVPSKDFTYIHAAAPNLTWYSAAASQNIL